MRFLPLSLAVGFLLALATSSRAQTVENKVDQAVTKEKKKAFDPREAQTAADNAAILEDLLAKALKNNPDIRVAESKLREAEAELNRARLLVMQKVVTQQREFALYQASMKTATDQWQRLKQLHNAGAATEKGVHDAEKELQKIKSDLARVESDLAFLMGSAGNRLLDANLGGGITLTPDGKYSILGDNMALDFKFKDPKKGKDAKGQKQDGKESKESNVAWAPVTVIHKVVAPGEWFVTSGQARLPAAMADKIRKALDAPVTVDLKQAKSTDILDFVRQHSPGINVVQQFNTKNYDPIDFTFKEPVPVGAIIQFLEDQGYCSFVVREYGIVMVGRANVPPGAVHLHDLWKSRPAQATPTPGQQK